jgi:hypothetical protein
LIPESLTDSEQLLQWNLVAFHCYQQLISASSLVCLSLLCSRVQVVINVTKIQLKPIRDGRKLSIPSPQ